MIWTIIIIVIVFILIRFVLSLTTDNNELKKQTIKDKFSILINYIDENFFSASGVIKTVDDRTLNIYHINGGRVIQLFYSSGNLNLSYKIQDESIKTITERNFPNVRSITAQQQKGMAQDFLTQIEKKLRAYSLLSDMSSTTNTWSIEEKTKYQITIAFYKFCFAKETGKVFLEDSEMRTLLSRGIALSIFEKEKTLLVVFKTFAKKTLGMEFGENSYNIYRINGFKFYLDVISWYVDENSHFEVLFNDVEHVKNEQGEDINVAEKFIVYMKDGISTAIFVTVYEPYSETHSIRMLHKDGSSNKLTFIHDNNKNEVYDYLCSFVIDKF